VGQVAHVRRRRIPRHGDAQQAQFAHLLPQVHRELVAAVDFGGARRDLARRELLHCLAQCGDVFAVVKGQAREMQHVVLVLVVEPRTGYCALQ
jgi:hypothetical protein